MARSPSSSGECRAYRSVILIVLCPMSFWMSVMGLPNRASVDPKTCRRLWGSEAGEPRFRRGVPELLTQPSGPGQGEFGQDSIGGIAWLGQGIPLLLQAGRLFCGTGRESSPRRAWSTSGSQPQGVLPGAWTELHPAAPHVSWEAGHAPRLEHRLNSPPVLKAPSRTECTPGQGPQACSMKRRSRKRLESHIGPQPFCGQEKAHNGNQFATTPAANRGGRNEEKRR